MKFDYTLAEKFSAVLRSHELEYAFNAINMAAGQYFADDVNRENVMRAFCAKSGQDVDKAMSTFSNDLLHITELPAHTGEFDVPAREKMIRWAMKETFLDVALNSGAIQIAELSDLDKIKAGTFTVAHTEDLRKLGFPKLSAIASCYVLRDLK